MEQSFAMLTRRDILVKWSSYGVVTLLLLLLHALTLRSARILGVMPFLPPLLVGVVASLEDTRASSVYALVLGLACDLTIPATFPGVYTLAFTVAAIACSLLAKSVLQPGILCSLAVTALTFFFVDTLNIAALWLKSRAAFAPMASLALRETAASSLMLIVCQPVLQRLHRKFTL